MKLKSALSAKPMMTIAICGSLLMSQTMIAADHTGGKHDSSYNDDEKPAKKAKEKTKSYSSLNNPALKIYPDALKREMHVVAKDNDGREIDFFVFDLQGTLLQNYKMQPKDHNKISGLKRGTYIYRAFRGDEETAAGQFEIR
ncbi:MAG: T9SS type A sorting domain-containing protein [Chitinophagaceae bacterium]